MVRQEVTYHDNYEIASYKEYYNDTLIEEILYNKHGRIHGKYCKWYSNGNPSVFYNCVNGSAHGLCYNWYENGQMESEVSYRDGRRNGKARKWYENGQMESETIYLDDKITGFARGWLENGEPRWHYQH